MIIDLSYFSRLINVASLDKPAIADKVNEFIVQYETEYLQRILGYQLATDFMNGLAANPVDQKWTNLLIGATYTATDGTTRKWNGFASTMAYPSLGLTDTGFTWFVGTTGSPAAGSTSFSDDRLINKQYFIERKGAGTMTRLADDNSNASYADYSFTSTVTNGSKNTVTLLQPGISFQANEVYIIHVTGYVQSVNNATVNISPIAYYVFFNMVRDMNKQISGLGVYTQPKAENSEAIAPLIPLVQVWNKMVDLNRSLIDFLNANNTTYANIPAGNYYYANCSSNQLLVKINPFGI